MTKKKHSTYKYYFVWDSAIVLYYVLSFSWLTNDFSPPWRLVIVRHQEILAFQICLQWTLHYSRVSYLQNKPYVAAFEAKSTVYIMNWNSMNFLGRDRLIQICSTHTQLPSHPLHTCTPYHLEWCVLRVMVLGYRTVGDSVVGNKEGPSPPWTVVLVTAMEEVTMEKQSITRLHLNMLQGQHLYTHRPQNFNYYYLN